MDVARTLGNVGPSGVDVEWWFEVPREHRGRQPVDLPWNGGKGLKVWSVGLCDLVTSLGAPIETFEIDVRLRSGDPVEGYLGVLEPTGRPGGVVPEVHSLWEGRRSSCVVVSDRVREAVVGARLTGIEWEEWPDPFPGDSGYFDDEDQDD